MAGASVCGDTSETYDVIVVGGGLAGLSCALWLHEHAHIKSLLVLEARDRVGGRTHTVPVGAMEPHAAAVGAPAPVVDLGGQWVGPSQSRVRALAARFRLELVEQPYPKSASAVTTEGAVSTAYEGCGLPPTMLTAVEAEEFASAWVDHMRAASTGSRPQLLN